MTAQVTVIGNLTADPELRFTAAGRAVARFSVAVNRRWQNKTTQEWEEKVSFFNCTAWAELAENLATSCTRGMRIVVVGRLEQNSWETDAGEKRSTIELVADEAGPSLRWATAEVSKIERSNGNGKTDRAPVPAGATGDDGYSEEPF